uniref:Uncharacterized protein n=1 Tax=Rhizophora mucronata TaxID=61149 RepID=A0A2P2PF57_RHIMU
MVAATAMAVMEGGVAKEGREVEGMAVIEALEAKGNGTAGSKREGMLKN